MAAIKGSCSCGKVAYQSSADPVFTGVCHCRACQKATGSAFATVVAVPTASLTVTGTPRRVDRIGDSGKPTHRDFCPDCGSTVTESVDVTVGLTMVTVGTSDDPSWVTPTKQAYCDSAQPWVSLGGGIQSFPKMPG